MTGAGLKGCKRRGCGDVKPKLKVISEAEQVIKF